MKSTLENLSKEELLNLIEMFSVNWLTVDGLWFTLVEDKFGLEAALELDRKMWEKQAMIEAHRIKKYMGLEETGIEGVLKVLSFMTFNPAMPFSYSLDKSDENSAYMWFTSCRPQEARMRTGRGEFCCKDVGLACYEAVTKVIDPAVRVDCVFCPPDGHPADIWCKWKLTCNK